MLVYRLCNEKELKLLLDEKSFKHIAREFYPVKTFNNHPYKKYKKYVHFFHNFDSIFYLTVNEEKYLCTYNIPDEILRRSKGIGFYYDRIHLEKLEDVEEYAVEEDELDISYLQKIQKVLRYIDFEDYILKDYKDGLQTVYNKNGIRRNKPKIKIKKEKEVNG